LQESGFEPDGPLETDRLVLRRFVPSDLAAVFAIHSRADVARYLYWEARTEDEVRTALEKKVASTAIRSEGDALFLAVVLKATDELIGDVVLQLVSQIHRQGEIGYIVHPDHQGQGYATEAVGVLLHLAFEELKLHRVIGRVEARNVASGRVLRSSGCVGRRTSSRTNT
jgi:RimJ/RimL family protein N-acetyltransferase